MSSYLLCRLENYTTKSAGAVLGELEHSKDKGYNNPDWKPEKTEENVTLFHDANRDGKTFEQYINDYVKENDVQGRITKSGEKATKTLTEFVVTASPEYLNGLSRHEQDRFFNDSFKSLKKQFPTYHWVDVKIHYDEKTPHLQAAALPVVYNKTRDRMEMNATYSQGGDEHYKELYKSYKMRGCTFMRDFQDNVYKDMSRNWNLERGISREDRKHMSHQEWKDLQTKEKAVLEREKGITDKEQSVNAKKIELQHEIDKYKNEPVPRKTILLGTYKYNKGDVEKIVTERNTLLSMLEQQKQSYMELKDKAISVIDKTVADKEQAEYERDLALQERDRAVEIGRTIDNAKERNKALDRLEEYGIMEPIHTKEHDREMTVNGR